MDKFLLPTFINCSLSESKCERNDWTLGGVAGKCDNTTSLCLCPSGYSGLDDFDYYNDCHVSHKVRDGARIASLVVSLISFIVSAWLAGKLLFKWGIIYMPSSIESNTQPESVGGGAASSPDAKRNNSHNNHGNNNNNTNSKSINGAEGDARVSDLNSSDPVIPSPLPLNGIGENIDINKDNGNDDNHSSSGDADVAEDKNVEEHNGPSDALTAINIVDEVDAKKRRDKTISQKYGFLYLSGERKESEVESTNDGNENSTTNDLINKGSKMSPPRKSQYPVLPGKNDMENYVSQTIKAVPKKIPRASIRTIKQLVPYTGNIHEPRNALRDEITRKRRVLILVILIHGFSLFVAIYNILMLFFDQSRRNNDALVNISLSIMVTCIISSIWSLAYIWFGSLPNLASYGKLFKIDSVLIRHPDLVRKLTLGNCVLTALGAIAILVIVPAVSPQSKYTMDTVAMIFGSLLIFTFSITFLSICSILLKCFDALLNNPLLEKSKKDSDQKAITKAKSTVKTAMMICSAIGISIALVFCLLAFAPAFRTNSWIFIPVMTMFGCAILLWIQYIVVIRQSGGKS